MSYTYLQELDINHKKVHHCAAYENMHSLPNIKRTSRIQKINSRSTAIVVPTMRERLSEENLRGQSKKEPGTLCKLAEKICGDVFRKAQRKSPQVLRFGDCSEIQHDEIGGISPHQDGRFSMQSMLGGIRPYKAITKEKSRSLSQDRKGARVSLLALQHSSWTR